VWELLSRYRSVVAIAVLLTAPLVLLYAQTRNPNARGPIVSVIIDIAGVIERGMLSVTGAVSDGIERYVTSVATMDELFALRRESIARDVLEARISVLESENDALRALANAAERIDGPRPVGARIIGRSGEPLSRIARIDRGRRDGVRRGDGVMSSTGVVGRVQAVGATASDVLLLTDPSSVVDGVVARSRARGLVRGTGDADVYRARIEDFDRLADVREGDLFVTSGLDPAWPGGLLLGRVALVEDRSDGLYRRAEVIPAAPLATVEHVLVLIRRDQSTPPQLAGTDDGLPLPGVDEGPAPAKTKLAPTTPSAAPTTPTAAPTTPTAAPTTPTAAPTTTPAASTTTSAPATMTPAASTTTPAPATMTPAPPTMTPAPATPTSAPATTTPAPATTTPAPATATPAPATTTPAPRERPDAGRAPTPIAGAAP
jgi:rod shape-determining protein MreC